ncbi:MULTISPECIES: flagellar hook-associated protein FlgK [unclassified Brevundimonas]|uniref:flagellar hook-associated protein FlgK n=1 Tax=unclassified Brevundimonas TaxID=2622653 RepID=UPI000CFCA97E|nr:MULTISPECIES: flagellar hook-associated protein FlgK [unclassified Brevundimonas]PRA35820.1 flagellar hook-associated protein FlgK [Brevundimonas sp. MYb27]PQZ83083.1 flagellar hook-associated protein FlgK [Brevundimonas sp. MYb31]PRB16355.1 flagellar hook-associated protein FlgK [Brevundimonas sp. MYb52]PRB34954.1 flagellar hook-associated protein FlgK [Brevundimonas sp. MYb46]PRB55538.1 flagellar hook-associated protein FlgK [Brevundimonas sp. MYb33]
MSLNSIMNIATSGMNTAQQQLRVISDNVSNVNTPGYIRKIADQQSWASQGVGAGVEVARIRLATDRFLQAASLNAGADAGRQAVRYELFDHIQSLFGDPGADTGFFSQIDKIFSAFSTSAENATSGPLRQDAIWKTQAMFDEAARVAKEIQATREEADGRLASAVDRVNDLVEQIEKLNVDIAKANVVGTDSTGAQTIQASLINELSELMDVRITTRSVGGVEVRTGAGILLAGQGASKLEYNRAGAVSSESVFNQIMITEPNGQRRPLTEGLASGEIKGLLELRDVDAPAAADRLGELMTRLADELNRAHNASSAVPAPSVLNGRNVGQTLETALSGFTGTTTITTVNDQGVIQNSAEIVFSGGTMTINGVAATPATFLATLNGQLGGATASFVDGRLSIQAPAGQGVAIADDATNPSNKAGRGFSHYFGLNDLVSTDRPALYDTGLTAASQHGFTPGETIKFRFTDASGSRIRDISVAVPAGAGTMAEMLTALNDPTTGVGQHGRFSLNGAGELIFTGHGAPPSTMSVVEDGTRQVPSGVSMSDLFGLSGARASRSGGFSVRSDIVKDPSKLALAQLNLGVAAGTPALSKNDGSGGRLLANADQNATSFSAAGGAGGVNMSLSRYAAEFSGEIGGKATMAKNRSTSASALYQEASARRSSVEGVNMDEELVLMTTYQQAFNASARLIQAASEMYDTLIGMMR